MVWFTSDSHHGHYNIIKYCNRPFSSIEEMDKTIINNINAVVGPNDTLYHLGDWSMGPQAIYRDQINCKNIHLVVGNHDKQVDRKLFVSVRDINEYRDGNVSIVLCHYPFRTWRNSCHGSWSLYGHCHCRPGFEDQLSLSFDVGVDGHDFKPWSLDQIKFKMEEKIKYRETPMIDYII